MSKETKEENKGRLAWFQEAKFGMFINWGVWTLLAGEWQGKGWFGDPAWIMKHGKIMSGEYEKFAAQFNPVRFNARTWVDLAKDTGMKYIVISTKLHDGFCMYDSKLTDYNIVKATPFGRDPMKEIASACHEAGIKLCFYYSNCDWYHPEFPAKYSQGGFHGSPNPDADINKYAAYMKGQIQELLTNYGPVSIVWFDGGGSFKGYNLAELLRAQDIIDMIHQLQPDCLINDRLRIDGDYVTPEQIIPHSKSQAPFEVCMTLNDHWGYNKYDHNWKGSPEIIRKLADICSKGGNFLLNIGPTAEGNIPADSVCILKEVGEWIKVNGDSIHGTIANPLWYTPFRGRLTARRNKLYLHVFDWPRDGRLPIQIPENRVKNACLLADPKRQPLTIERTDREVVVHLPAEAPDLIDTVVMLEFEKDW